ncbi:MAG: TfpX/TfpZ family type IV pilin accessory protein [Moraxella sp.]
MFKISKSRRLKAFLLHLFVSIIVIVLTTLVIYQIWYPSPLAVAAGVTGILLLMMTVDVILGPLLTLLVYKEGKKSLKFDLTVIILIQISAFFYGIWTISQGRPVWLVFNVDRFDVVHYQDIDKRKINEAKLEFQSPSWLGPKFVASLMPDDVDERNSITFEAVFSGVDIAQRPNLYVPFHSVLPTIKQKKLSLKNLNEYNSPSQIKNILNKYPQATGYLPLKANKVDMSVLIDKDGNVVKIVDLRPWNTQ